MKANKRFLVDNYKIILLWLIVLYFFSTDLFKWIEYYNQGIRFINPNQLERLAYRSLFDLLLLFWLIFDARKKITGKSNPFETKKKLHWGFSVLMLILTIGIITFLLLYGQKVMGTKIFE